MSSSPPRLLPNPKRLSAPSPIRKPLTERSDSGSNEQGPTPTIRIVPDTGPSSYNKSPFPSDPSHYLPPRGSKNSYRSSYPVSDENQHSLKSLEGESLVPKPLQPRSSANNRISTDTTLSSESETLSNYPPSFSTSLSSRLSFTNTTNTTTPSSPTIGTISSSGTNEDDSFASSTLKLPALPVAFTEQGRVSTASQSTIRLVTPERTINKLLPRQDKGSNFTIYSTDSTDTVAQHPGRRRRETSPPSSPNFQIYSSGRTSLDSTTNGQESVEEQEVLDEEEQQQSTENLAATSSSTANLNSSSDSVAYQIIPVIRPRSRSSPPASSYGTQSVEHLTGPSIDVVQYPVIRQASASGEFATVTDEFDLSDEEEEYLDPDSMLEKSEIEEIRMSDISNRDSSHRLSTLSSRLSTILSESEPRSQDDVVSELGRQSNDDTKSPKLRRVYGSISSVGTGESSRRSLSEIPVPQPLFTPRELPVVPQTPDSEVVAAEEGDDTIGDLPQPVLRPQRSGYLQRLKTISAQGSAESLKSQLSFHGDLSWVKTFYKTGDSWSKQFESPYITPQASMSMLDTRLDTATSQATSAAPTISPLSEAFPSEIHRPRNRPRLFGLFKGKEKAKNTTPSPIQAPVRPSTDTQRSIPATATTRPGRADSWATTVNENQRTLVDRMRNPQHWSNSVAPSGTLSPHLRRDQRHAQGFNLMSTPSLDAFKGKKFFAPLQRQIWLFCLGFLCPLLWFGAAFLPLPNKPASLDMETGHQAEQNVQMRPSELAEVEREEKYFLKAQWWRTLNRLMCVAGVAIIGAIVALVVLSLRVH